MLIRPSILLLLLLQVILMMKRHNRSRLVVAFSPFIHIRSFSVSIGASESRLTYTAEQLSVTNQNLTAANSAITDVDVAKESTMFARNNILVQAGTAMLAQANQLPQSVLKLLQ